MTLTFVDLDQTATTTELNRLKYWQQGIRSVLKNKNIYKTMMWWWWWSNINADIRNFLGTNRMMITMDAIAFNAKSFTFLLIIQQNKKTKFWNYLWFFLSRKTWKKIDPKTNSLNVKEKLITKKKKKIWKIMRSIMFCVCVCVCGATKTQTVSRREMKFQE